MATGIITIVGSILTLVAGYFVTKWINGYLQRYYSLKDENAVNDAKKDMANDVKKHQEAVDHLQEIEDHATRPPSSQDVKP